jgi:hypothetical protein
MVEAFFPSRGSANKDKKDRKEKDIRGPRMADQMTDQIQLDEIAGQQAEAEAQALAGMLGGNPSGSSAGKNGPAGMMLDRKTSLTSLRSVDESEMMGEEMASEMAEMVMAGVEGGDTRLATLEISHRRVEEQMGRMEEQNRALIESTAELKKILSTLAAAPPGPKVPPQ